jgi:hypothetical protein
MLGNSTIRKIMKTKASPSDEQILSVKECNLLIRWAEENDPELLIYPVICLFAGLRLNQEATRIDWSSITISRIIVDEKIAKDRQKRIIEPLTSNLIEWIRFIDSKGVKPFPLRNLRRRWDRTKQVLGRKWLHDSMRHSYASYHFAMFGNAELTARNLGHSDSTLLRRDYNGAVTMAEAHKLWSIVPKYILSNYPCNNFSSVDYPIQYQIA